MKARLRPRFFFMPQAWRRPGAFPGRKSPAAKLPPSLMPQKVTVRLMRRPLFRKDAVQAACSPALRRIYLRPGSCGAARRHANMFPVSHVQQHFPVAPHIALYGQSDVFPRTHIHEKRRAASCSIPVKKEKTALFPPAGRVLSSVSSRKKDASHMACVRKSSSPGNRPARLVPSGRIKRNSEIFPGLYFP